MVSKWTRNGYHMYTYGTISDSQSYRVANELNSSTVGSTCGTANMHQNFTARWVKLKQVITTPQIKSLIQSLCNLLLPSTLKFQPQRSLISSLPTPPYPMPNTTLLILHAKFKSTLTDHTWVALPKHKYIDKLGFPDKGFIRMKTGGQDATLQ
jgi:hypothetical protein